MQDTIQRIKSIATRIFAEVNQTNSSENFPGILKDFDQKYWHKILDFTSNYFDINVPNASELKKLTPYQVIRQTRKEALRDFSEEYRMIVESSKAVGKEFIQRLHEFRSKKVNPSHLELEELFSPLKLYNYLRNRHWKEGIPESFLRDWSEKVRKYNLSDDDISEFERVCCKLGLPLSTIPSPDSLELKIKPRLSNYSLLDKIPSLHDNWQEFRIWVIRRLESLSQLIDRHDQTLKENQDLKSFLLEEFSKIYDLTSKKTQFTFSGR